MKKGLLGTALLGLGLAFGMATVSTAQAAAILFNTGDESTASVAIGVNDEGHLNVRDPFGAVITDNAGEFGVAYKFPDGTWQDATAPGCLCEGWGVSATLAGGGSVTGYANVSVDGVVNLTVDSFVTDAAAGTGSTATSVIHLTDTIGLRVTQVYSPADFAPGVLFKNEVTISNETGGTITDVRYVRVMDWDIPLDEFNEFVTIIGTVTTTLLEESHNDGFATANPLGATFPIDAATLNVDFIDNGPADHGAYFRFNFGEILDGESFSFTIFYGAAGNEADALAAAVAEGIELLSLGQESGDPTGGTPATFIFGFKGVGGVVIDPDPIPEPATLAIMAIGLAGLGFARRRRKVA